MTNPIHIVGVGGTLRIDSRSLYALDYALSIAQSQGASVTRFSMFDLQLPMYDPSRDYADEDATIKHFIETIRTADGMIWSTGAYHGTLAGVTKNAIDYMQYLSGGEHPYLHNKVIGLIATAGGDMAGVNTLTTMTHSVHSLRGTVAPLMVSIHNAKSTFDTNGNIVSEKYEKKLNALGKLVVELTKKLKVSREASV